MALECELGRYFRSCLYVEIVYQKCACVSQLQDSAYGKKIMYDVSKVLFKLQASSTAVWVCIHNKHARLFLPFQKATTIFCTTHPALRSMFDASKCLRFPIMHPHVVIMQCSESPPLLAIHAMYHQSFRLQEA